MNKEKAIKVIAKVRKRKLSHGSDLSVSIAGTDYAVHFICLFMFILFGTSIGIFDKSLIDADMEVIILRSITFFGIITCLILLIILYSKMKAVRDYIVSHSVQNLDEIED